MVRKGASASSPRMQWYAEQRAGVERGVLSIAVDPWLVLGAGRTQYRVLEQLSAGAGVMEGCSAVGVSKRHDTQE